jgi:hypothetical protein
LMPRAGFVKMHMKSSTSQQIILHSVPIAMPVKLGVLAGVPARV